MITKNELIAAVALNARREALNGKRFNVIFYGGWFAVDEHTGKTKKANSMANALLVAEFKNAKIEVTA